MSTQYQTATGCYHVQVKLHGSPERIRLFHAILREIESDWCFHARQPHEQNRMILVCKICRGIRISNTRLAPQDIKAAAAQCGIGCKINNFAKEDKCGDFATRGVGEYVDRQYASVLWSHKPGRINLGERKAWVGEPAPRVIVMPGVTEMVQ